LIPSFKPYLGKEELLAAMGGQKGALTRFENDFARSFQTRYAIAFPYGRSGLWALFQALGLERAEIIMPAYTCVVVAHAIVLSNNIPRFVDISFHDYNMNLDQVESAISEKTRAIIPTHLFGYPLDLDHLREIVDAAEARWGHKIWVIQDCAHSFGARWRGKLVCTEGDAALFGLNISKLITSIFGGMVTTNSPELYEKLRAFRDKYFLQPGRLKRIRRFFYLASAYAAFNDHIYGITNFLKEKTSLLNKFTIAYHLDGAIRFPPDHLEQMGNIEARVGLVQLQKYDQIMRDRWQNVLYFDQHLKDLSYLEVPPVVKGATYSHYVIRVPDRQAVLKAFGRKGIELGELIQYSIPHMYAYKTYVGKQNFPNSYLCSKSTINLPIHAGLDDHHRKKIVTGFREIAPTLNQVA
jgi:dTDP-4-amino-4,6-dideoxygalactose transaminase